jgi:hypothetical protein
MPNFLKRRGSLGSLFASHARERVLLAAIEARVDGGLERRSLIEALIAQLRVQAQFQPGDASWRFFLGRLLMAVGDPVEARNELEAATELDPRDPRIAAHLALWYEAALLAACGECSNVDLPPLAGPSLCANVSRFAALVDTQPVDVLAARAAEWAAVALRFRLPEEDRRFLQYHLEVMRTHPIATPVTLMASADTSSDGATTASEDACEEGRLPADDANDHLSIFSRRILTNLIDAARDIRWRSIDG